MLGAESSPPAQVLGLSSSRLMLTASSSGQELGAPMWMLINLLGAHAQSWAFFISQMPAQSVRGSQGPGLSWWLWLPALPPSWDRTYPAEADLGLGHADNRVFHIRGKTGV